MAVDSFEVYRVTGWLRSRSFYDFEYVNLFSAISDAEDFLRYMGYARDSDLNVDYIVREYDIDRTPVGDAWVKDSDNIALITKEFMTASNFLRQFGVYPSVSEASEDREPDVVNHPAHYETAKGFECKDVIIEAIGLGGYLMFCLGNVIKYVFRHLKKGGIEDLRKAKWYLDTYLELSDDGESSE